MRKYSTRDLSLAAVVAALYTVLGYFGNIFGLNFGMFQCRFAEALCVLPFFFPATAPGLFVGCLAANLLCGAPLPDIIFGSLATLLAAIATRRLRKNVYLAALAPVISNGVIVGIMLSVVYAVPLLWSCFTVAVGEVAACYVLGIPLLKGVEKLKIF